MDKNTMKYLVVGTMVWITVQVVVGGVINYRNKKIMKKFMESGDFSTEEEA